MTQDGPPRKPRHRRRATAAAGPPQPPAPATAAPATTAPPTKTPAKSPAKSPAKTRTSAKAGQGRRRNEAERGLRDIAGAGSSQVGVSRALRARDVNRPTADDLAHAESDLQLVRRNWRPQS